VKGVHFKCQPLKVSEAHAKARTQGRRTVRVCIDPLLVDSIWLIQGDEETPTAYVRATLDMRFHAQRTYQGSTWREVLKLVDMSTVNNLEAREDVNEHLAALATKQQQIATEAVMRMKTARQDFPTSEAALIRNRLEAREVEKNLTSPALAITAPLQPPLEESAAQVVPITHAQRIKPATKRSRFSQLVDQFHSDESNTDARKPANHD
jgi:hypothetical protein